ncbi:thiamine phosphate synthase [Salimicrobium sp. PL1-032A]|uniref:thiamine phosphate synthase n=1 Tax=Salimicrobium sp. PL1-032A TaxID=3095364 RepID=UPI003260906F
MLPSLHLISTGRQSFSELSSIVNTIQQSFDYLHVREKHRSPEEIYEGATHLIQNGFPKERLIINTHADVATAIDAYGVHLPGDGLSVPKVKRTYPDLVVGTSVHSLGEALDAEETGADYTMFGNLYSTPSKPGKSGKGVRALTEITHHLHHPVIGIGGITPERTSEVLSTGVAGTAVMSGVLLSDDPKKAIYAYDKIRKGVHTNDSAL